MSVALFAMLGAYADAGAGYWICFSIFAFCYGLDVIIKIVKGLS